MYGGVPSVHKSREEVDTAPYHSEGKTLREELADVPKAARAAEKQRVREFLGLPGATSKRGVAARLSREELADRVVADGLKDHRALAAAARAEKADDLTLYNTLLFMGRKDLQDFLGWVWDLEGQSLREEVDIDRVAKLCDAARTAACTCNGRWLPAAEEVMKIQHLNSIEFRRAVLKALACGRRKGVNILVLGAPDAGKSFCFKPLGKIFKTFVASGQTENYPLQGLPGSELALLQDIRYESFGLPWDDLLRWGEGDAVKINLPRNNFLESVVYNGIAPLIATMASPFSFPLDEAKRTGRGIEMENVQFKSRWRQIAFPHSIPEQQRDSSLEQCAKCCAFWYVGAIVSSGVQVAGAPSHACPTAVAPVHIAVVSHISHAIAAPVATPVASAASSTASPEHKRRRILAPDEFFARMHMLMEWRQEGLLDSSQFENAKFALNL